jgi:hypothetical protein
MNERDARRAQSEAVRRAMQETRDERRATRLERPLQRYLASAYFAVLSRGTSRRSGDDGEAR